MRVGIVSDTHGMLRAEVFEVLAGVDHLLHAGDVGPAELLAELEAIAPLTVVWGNTDGFDVRERTTGIAEVELDGVRVVVLHGHQLGSPSPGRAAAAYPEAGLVVYGHSHRPEIQRVGPVLAVNPGSAGAVRFSLPTTVAIAEVQGGRVDARLIHLDPTRR